MELNKTIQDLKMEVETIKKSQNASISNRIQEMEERISGAEDSIPKKKKWGTTIKDNAKFKKS
jgi:predicted  nucleic acid-binding Zn-ribbon protein